MKQLKDIIKTEAEIIEMGHGIANNIIENVDINIVAHFNNCVCFEVICSDVVPMSGYRNTANIGAILKAFVELFDIEREDGIRISSIKHMPCRLIFQNAGNGPTWGCRCIGFGHFMKDRFVLIEDFAKLGIDDI